MASAYVILCDRLGHGREAEIARAMRRRAPHACPNSLLVRHADDALGRDGRMLAALEAMGPPVMMLEGATTDFPAGRSVSRETIRIGLSAAIVSVEGGQPCALVVTHGDGEDSLPFGPFDPGSQHTLEQGLRKWVGEQTRFDLGYTEQLYTFGDRGRHSGAGAD